MIQYYYTKKEWGVVMEKEELKILEELRRILNSKNEAIVILNNYFKGGVGKSKLSTMFAYLTDKFNLKVLMIDKDLQATLTKDLAKTFKVELPRVNFYEGLKNGNLASSIVHLTDNLDLIPGTFDLMLLPKLTRSWTFENESRLLATLLAPLKSDYDLIIIDTVPTPKHTIQGIIMYGIDALIMSSGLSIRTAFSGMLFSSISLSHGCLPSQTFSQFLLPSHIICAILISSTNSDFTLS